MGGIVPVFSIVRNLEGVVSSSTEPRPETNSSSSTISSSSYNKLCAWRHNIPPPVQVDNILVFILQTAPVLACWLYKTSATSRPLTF